MPSCICPAPVRKSHAADVDIANPGERHHLAQAFGI
jgi:hypothetical protein